MHPNYAVCCGSGEAQLWALKQMSHLWVIGFVVLREGDALDAPQGIEPRKSCARVAHIR